MIKDIRINDAFYFPNPPSNWRRVAYPLDRKGEHVGCWQWNGLIVMATAGEYDGTQWLHVSFSRERKMPTYAEMQMVKRDFIGNDRKAIFVLPKAKDYVNIHPNCLHLWTCEKDVIPDFEGKIGNISTI